MSKENYGKVEKCSRIKGRNGSLSLGKDGVRRIWNDYFEDLHNIDTKEQVFREVITS